MKAEERKQKILEITRSNVFSTDGKGKRLRYRGEVKTFVEYEIPIELLVYNVENGRIASLVKSFEKEHSTLNPERKEDALQIARFLYDSNDIANKKTKKDIAENGQLETGIITSDGVIVDGNRRASLMLSILNDESNPPAVRARCEKFRTVVLPEDADEKEILRLETTFQMGTDEKVGYNAIEKYLHAYDMQEKGFSIADIEEYMGLESTSKVNELLQVKGLIDDYLDYYDYTGIYTRLPRGFEDDLQKLNQAIRKIKDGRIGWIPNDRLVEVENDLKCICFDFIRLNAKSREGFDFRAIASTANNNFLMNEDVWNRFVEAWQNSLKGVKEESIDEVLATSKGAGDTDRLLENRDNKWRKTVGENLMEGFTDAKNTIENQKEKSRPSFLLRKAINALREIDVDTLVASDDKQGLNEQLLQISGICDKLHSVIK